MRALLIICFSCFGVCVAAAETVVIHLTDALVREDGQGSDLYLTGHIDETGAMGLLLGTGPDYNRGMHRGRLLAGQVGDGSYTLEVDVLGDPWVIGGRLNLQVDGATYTGSFEAFSRPGQPLL